MLRVADGASATSIPNGYRRFRLRGGIQCCLRELEHWTGLYLMKKEELKNKLNLRIPKSLVTDLHQVIKPWLAE